MYDVKAEITLIPTQENGRRMQTCSGWRPQFHYPEQEEYEDWDTVFLTDDTVEWVYPGQTVAAYLSFPSPQHHVGKLYPGKEFLLREGRRVVAKGRVLEVLALEESAKKRLEAESGLRQSPP